MYILLKTLGSLGTFSCCILLTDITRKLYIQNLFTSAGNFEKCVTLLRDKNKAKDLAPVVQSIFSHASVSNKNQLTIMLIVSTCNQSFKSVFQQTFSFLSDFRL